MTRFFPSAVGRGSRYATWAGLRSDPSEPNQSSQLRKEMRLKVGPFWRSDTRAVSNHKFESKSVRVRVLVVRSRFQNWI